MEEEQPIAARMSSAGVELGAAPAFGNDQLRAGGLGDEAGLVSRAAIDEDGLLHQAVDHGRNESGEGGPERPLGVERGNDHRDHGAPTYTARFRPAIVTCG